MTKDRASPLTNAEIQAPSPLSPALSEDLHQEQEYIRRIQQGDEKALSEWYEKRVDRIYNYFYARFHNASIAEEVTSETFTRAIEALMQGRYAWQGKPSINWLYGIAAKVGNEKIRDLKRNSSTGQLEEGQEPISEEDDPLNAVLQKEEMYNVWALVDKLTEVEQELLYLRYVHGYSFAEIAVRLGRTGHACKQLHYRILRKLKQMVQEIL